MLRNAKNKKKTLPARRQALSFIFDTKVTDKVFDELATRFAERKGGYTRCQLVSQALLSEESRARPRCSSRGRSASSHRRDFLPIPPSTCLLAHLGAYSFGMTRPGDRVLRIPNGPESGRSRLGIKEPKHGFAQL